MLKCYTENDYLGEAPTNIENSESIKLSPSPNHERKRGKITSAVQDHTLKKPLD